MALTGNGTSSHLISPATIPAATVANITVHFWYRNTGVPSNAAIPGASAARRPAGVISTGNTYFMAFSWDHETPGREQAWIANEAGGTAIECQYATSLAADTWYALGGTYDGTNLKAWLNGAVDETTACAAFTLLADPFVTALSGREGVVDWDDGTMAELAIWSDDLSTDDMVMLSKGISPLMVRPDILILYWPMRNVSGYNAKGAPATVTAATAAAHPSVIYPAGMFSGGMYTDVVSTADVDIVMLDTASFTEDLTDPGNFSDTVTATEAYTLQEHWAQNSDTVIAIEEWIANSGYLKTGRMRDRIRK